MLAHHPLREIFHSPVENDLETGKLGGGGRPAALLPGARRNGGARGHVHGVAVARRGETAERDAACLHLRNVENPFTEIPEPAGQHRERTVHRFTQHEVWNSEQDAVFHELIDLEIRSHLAGQHPHHDLCHGAEAVVFRHRAQRGVLGQQREDH